MPNFVGSTDGPAEYMIKVLAPERDIAVSAFMPENFTSSVSSDYDVPFAEGFIRNLPGGERIHLAARLAGFGTTTQAMSMQVWQGTAPMDFSIPIQFLLNEDPEKDILAPMRALMSLTLPRRLGGDSSASEGSDLNNALLISPGPKLRPKGQINVPTREERIEFVRTLVSETEEFVSNLTRDVISGDILENLSLDRAQEIFEGGSLFKYVSVTDNIILQIGQFLLFESVVITNVDSDYEVKLDKERRKPIALNATIGFRTFVTPKANDLTRILLQ